MPVARPPGPRDCVPQTRMKPRSRYIAHSSALTHDLSSSRARCSARRSRPGSKTGAPWPSARARRRARRASERRSSQGRLTSHSRASTTIAVAHSATVTARSSAGAARGPREEDHAAGLTWDLLERVHELGLAAAGLCLGRDRGPHALLELAPELLDEALLVFGDLDVALGDELLAVTRAHAQEPHRAIMSRGGWRAGPLGRSARRRPRDRLPVRAP